jgi:hypothetical protein
VRVRGDVAGAPRPDEQRVGLRLEVGGAVVGEEHGEGEGANAGRVHGVELGEGLEE